MPKTFLGLLLGSDEAAFRFIERLGVLPFLEVCVRWIDRQLRRLPFLSEEGR